MNAEQQTETKDEFRSLGHKSSTIPSLMFTMALHIVNTVLANSGLSADVKLSIEKLLVMHLTAEATFEVKKSDIGSVSTSFQKFIRDVNGLNSTAFGRQAMALDTTNSLALYGADKAKIKKTLSNLSYCFGDNDES